MGWECCTASEVKRGLRSEGKAPWLHQWCRWWTHTETHETQMFTNTDAYYYMAIVAPQCQHFHMRTFPRSGGIVRDALMWQGHRIAGHWWSSVWTIKQGKEGTSRMEDDLQVSVCLMNGTLPAWDGYEPSRGKNTLTLLQDETNTKNNIAKWAWNTKLCQISGGEVGKKEDKEGLSC